MYKSWVIFLTTQRLSPGLPIGPLVDSVSNQFAALASASACFDGDNADGADADGAEDDDAEDDDDDVL